MGRDSLQSLMTAKVYAEYDRIRKNDGGANPDIVDTQKGREELGKLLSGTRSSIKSSEADVVLLKALAKVYDNCPTRSKAEITARGEGILDDGDFLLSLLSDVGLVNYGYICSTGDDYRIVDTPKEYKLLKQLIHLAKRDNDFSKADVIMFEALLKVASDYAPQKPQSPFWKNLKPKSEESKPVVPTPNVPKTEIKKNPKVQTTPPKTEPQKPQQGNEKLQPKQENNQGINNSFNNNSGVIIIDNFTK